MKTDPTIALLTGKGHIFPEFRKVKRPAIMKEYIVSIDIHYPNGRTELKMTREAVSSILALQQTLQDVWKDEKIKDETITARVVPG